MPCCPCSAVRAVLHPACSTRCADGRLAEPAAPASRPAGAAAVASRRRREPAALTRQPQARTAAIRRVTTGTLVFQSDVAGRPKIFTIDVATGQVRQLTHGADWRDESPRWSPDGQFIAFTSNRAHYGPQAGDRHARPRCLRDARRRLAGATHHHRSGQRPRPELAAGRPGARVLVGPRVARRPLSRAGRRRPHRPPHDQLRRHARSCPRCRPTVDGRLRGADAAGRRVLELPGAPARPRHGTHRRRCPPAAAPAGRRGRATAGRSTTCSSIASRRPSSVATSPAGRSALAHANPTLWSYYPRVSPDGQWLALSVSPEHHDGEDWDLALVSTSDPVASRAR